MKTLSAIFTELQNRMPSAIRKFRISAAQNETQLLREIRAVSMEQLPAVVARLDSIHYEEENQVRVLHIDLILINSFSAGEDTRTAEAMTLIESLQSVFPPEGIVLTNTLYLPEKISNAVPGDEDCLCLHWHFGLLVRE